jgi:hypothetical protein
MIIYDILTKQHIEIHFGEGIRATGRKYKIDYSAFYKLQKGQTHIQNRFILPSNQKKIFVLVELDTKKEFECISNKSIFLHLNIPYNENEAKYVFELRRRRQNVASIGNRIFYLKGFPPIKKSQKTKAISKQLLSWQKYQQLRSKIAGRLRCRIRKLIFNKKIRKNKMGTLDFLGCDYSFLMGYLEAKFTKGMTWENYGQWHVDHIRPCASFDLTKIEEQKKCFHYSNLQPLWATTQIAAKYGETDYVGNVNKQNKIFVGS